MGKRKTWVDSCCHFLSDETDISLQWWGLDLEVYNHKNRADFHEKFLGEKADRQFVRFL